MRSSVRFAILFQSRLFNLKHALYEPAVHAFLVLVLLVLPWSGWAQSDSLLQAAKGQKGAEKLETLKNLTYTTNNFNRGLPFCRLLFAEAQQQNNIEFQSFALGKMVEFYYSQFDTDSVFIVGQKFEDFCNKNKFYKHYFVVVNILTMRYVHQEDYTLALHKSEYSYELAKQQGNIDGAVNALYTQANIYLSMEQPDQAFQLFNEGIKLMDENKSTQYLLKLEFYQSISTLFVAKNDYETMLRHVDIFEKQIERVKASQPEVDLTAYSFNAHVNYVFCYANLGDLVKAKQHLAKASDLIQNTWPDNYLQELNQAYACYYTFLGDYQQALMYNQMTIDYYQQNNLGIGVRYQLWHRAEIFERMGNYQMACTEYSRLKMLADSVNVTRFSRQINELRTMYELDKLELEAEKTQLELKNSRTLAVLLSALALVLAAFVLVVLFNQKKLKEKNRSLFRQISEQKKWIETHGLHLSKEQTSAQTPPNAESNKVNALIASLNELMEREQLYTQSDLNRKKLAELLGSNETYLFEAIKQNYNLTFNEYLNVLRLDHARDLLAQPQYNHTIEAVAIDSGFGSRNTFYRLFRERYGLTPMEFRKLACEKVEVSSQ